ncbi:MAG: hypothetical protein HS111_25585 [Kofleriaceae bacterium]|nr:hypothetical protein [Kofleriaceae bacterium]MCL4223691.1 hypothetical protein [Myxococcales bacterium]
MEMAATRSRGHPAQGRGWRVAFVSDKPSLELAAHEASYVVQQQKGVHLKGDAGRASEAYEQEGRHG